MSDVVDLKDPSATLQTIDLSVTFGTQKAVDGVNLSIKEGEFLSIIGPNGAGKTTLFNLISGQLLPTRGHVMVYGKDITKLKPHQRTRAGMGRSFQLTNVYPTLSALENVRLSIQAKEGRRLSMLQSSDTKAFRVQQEQAEQLLDLVQLQKHVHTRASSLSHGDQRKLEIAMLVALGTKILLLDEPTAGMSQHDVPAMIEILNTIKNQGDRTILLIEHKMDLVTQLSDRIAVLVNGQLLTTGSPEDVATNPIVQRAYLGGSYGISSSTS